MIIRAILPDWAKKLYPERRKVREGEFTKKQIQDLNHEHYNIYFLPNIPSQYFKNKMVEGSDIDTFQFVFCDMDLKDGIYPDKNSFIAAISDFPLKPTRVVDSGNGIHIYWQVSDLEAMTYLKLQRRLIRKFRTDEAVGQIYQLLRVPNTYNTKDKDDIKLCRLLFEEENIYTAEELDATLPPLSYEDAAYCQQHFDKTYQVNEDNLDVNVRLPVKFGQLLESNAEVNCIWSEPQKDRSASDFRLGHLLFSNGFTRDEAMSVLINCKKALERAPKGRLTYAANIVEKIWMYETTKSFKGLNLSMSVKEILKKGGDNLKGKRFSCYKYLDGTHYGFRLGQIIGLVAGSGVGKTAIALNMFMGFVENNPDYDHFFVPLEQPANEIAYRWKMMCEDREELHEKVHVISNYDEKMGYRHLSLINIKEYILKFKEETGKKIGCVVIDHIGVLNTEGGDLIDVCKQIKAFTTETNTLLILQSQTSREKAGIGDLELNKDAAYGTVFFESFVDFLITVWQPLKRCYKNKSCPTVTAFKFCKIRDKKQDEDKIQEDVRYIMYFDPKTERLRQMTQDEDTAFNHFNKIATNLRGQDNKTTLLTYVSVKMDQQQNEGVTTK